MTPLPLRASLLVALVGGPALASSTFPAVVQTHLSLSAPPPQSCALCHTNGITGTGTVNTPFGMALRAKGAVATNEAALATALDQLQSGNVDSDGDGLSDIQELENGTDPNVANGADGGTGGGAGGGGGTSFPPPPIYGCGASSVPGLLGAAGLLLLAVLRRRR